MREVGKIKFIGGSYVSVHANDAGIVEIRQFKAPAGNLTLTRFSNDQAVKLSEFIVAATKGPSE
jgi:hypothetical protein